MTKQMQEYAAKIGTILAKVEDIERSLGEMRMCCAGRQAACAERFASKDEFNPIKATVYGGISLVLSAVIVALLGLLAWKGGL